MPCCRLPAVRSTGPLLVILNGLVIFNDCFRSHILLQLNDESSFFVSTVRISRGGFNSTAKCSAEEAAVVIIMRLIYVWKQAEECSDNSCFVQNLCYVLCRCDACVLFVSRSLPSRRLL